MQLPFLGQFQRLWAGPQMAAARPAIIAALVLMAALIGWSVVQQPDWRPLYAELSDGDKSAVLAALEAGNYKVRVNPTSGSIEVASGDVAAARILLAGQGLPKAARSLDMVGDMPLGLSRAVEAARLKGAMASELAASIEAIDGVKRATVHVALPEPSVFVRDRAPASASVFVALAPGRVLGEAQVRAIVWLVSSSVAGLAPERVSVVDQSGALLSAGVASGEAAQLGYQTRVEAMVRERLATLLTPIVGQGRFTAEVTADVDFTRSESASERFERDGSVLRTEQASRSVETAPAPARGIPGALSNTAPAAAQIAATPPEDTGVTAEAAPQITNETTNRAWEIGKDVRVSRGDGPRIRRLSVAVVIDRSAMLKDGKLPPGEVAALERLISGAIGRDASRGDQLELVLRDFAGPEAEPVLPWFAPEALRDYTVPIVAGLLLLAAMGFGGWWWWRRKKAVVVAAADGAAAATEPGTAPQEGGQLYADLFRPLRPRAAGEEEDEDAPAGKRLPRLIDYSDKLGVTRSLVSGDADRATAVARQMLAIDGDPADEEGAA
jgi:flagellar M-ring protein FliF